MATKKSYEFSLEIFRKQFCPLCGAKLVKKKEIKILKEGDAGFSKTSLATGYSPFITENKITTYFFCCDNCGKYFSDDEITKIRKLQKKEKSKILSSYQIE